EEMIKNIENSGGIFADVLLHVGLGTFEPVKEENVEEHKMHSEIFSVNRKTAEILTKAKKENTKILSIGTTTLRVLETIFKENGFFAETGSTDIFIYPPHKINSADLLLTNFHLPKSTLIMLVSAFAGREFLMDAYKFAVEKKYRFFSYGDAMLIV
ncbi:TPA: tRNA preQ1(34) S-adenosylmethionine ribosyltransferase-isomerase QueA, partial [candidate division WOR-3 bacterium]|nr:tRNA preQ1(34) S-adenosylmethionine ribosyltransferase-isomerase QueA [candidate division WOR-3 bacterium]